MSERPTILDVARFNSTFRFKITKPDQILAPIMEKWDVEIRPDLILKLCSELIQVAKEYCRVPTLQSQERVVHRGKALYRQLFLPGHSGDRLLGLLSESHSPLLISTDVSEIPWELLHDGQDFLGIRYAIGRQLLKSTGVPIATAWQGDQIRCLLIADPCNDLPEARQEVIQLKQWLLQQNIHADLLLGADANETEILVRLTSYNYNFIHYSGHVRTSGENHTQGLVLSDHQLYSTEIERTINNNGPIVVLNGCDTASVEGLADAFLKSGAQLVVGTLFDVPDQGARLWAESFYKGLISNLPAGEALRLARQSTTSKPEDASSGLAFVLYGNPCLQLVWGKAAFNPEVTVLDRVLKTIDLGRQDFDNTCLNILESSLSYAGETGVSSAHLFTAMLEGPDSRLRDYLLARNVDPVEMKKNFEQSFHFAELLFQTVSKDKSTEISLSESVSRVLSDASNLAQQANHSQATFDNLLFAFSQLENGGVFRLMKSLKVDLREMFQPPSPQVDAKNKPAGKREERIISVDNAPIPDVPKLAIRMRGDQSQIEVPNNSVESEGQPAASSSTRIVDRYADVDFPSSVVKSRFYVLRIQILLAKRNNQQVPLIVEMPNAKGQEAKVEVYVHAPNFDTQGPSHGVLTVPPDADSTVLEFHLAAKSPGENKIKVDFMQNSRYVGAVSVEITVVEVDGNTESGHARTVGRPAIGQIGTPPDLTILISHQILPNGEHQLKFVLHSPLPELKLYYRDAGISILLDSPAEWIEYNIRQIMQAVQRQNMVERRLERIGNKLWDELIPDAFKNTYWHIKDKIRTVLIVSDEPWIPWEMLRPYHKTDAGTQEDDFLCQKYSLARWIRGNPTTSSMILSESRVLGVGSNDAESSGFLPEVKEEITSVQSILNHVGVHTVSLNPRRADLFHTLAHGGFNHLHIASHGRSVPQGGDLAYIALEDGDIAAIDLTGPTLTFGNEHPLVFMNACETGQLGSSLTRLGGWAELFTEAGCSAFIGTLWAVEDKAAQGFAKAFYEEICRGTPLGDACRRARSSIRNETSASWLAYCLYADPQTVLLFPEEAPSEKTEVKTEKQSSDHLPPQEIRRTSEEDRYSIDVIKALKASFERAAEVNFKFVDSLLFFETLCAIPNGAVARAFQRLSMPADEVISLIRKVIHKKENQTGSAHLINEIGLSKSTVEILKIAEHLAQQNGHNLAQDGDVLEAFVLHNHNTITRLFLEADLKPQLLLNGAFQSNGELNKQRFSAAVQEILTDALQFAKTSHLLGSPQILAAMCTAKSGVARLALDVSGGSLDAYVQAKLNDSVVRARHPIPNLVSLEHCSTRFICILNLSELLARAEGTPTVEEKHLIKAYIDTE